METLVEVVHWHLDLFSWDYPILIDDLQREKELNYSTFVEKIRLKCVHFIVKKTML